MVMRWPTFLVIGAAKAGTTSLYHYLSQHPQVFMGGREPGFFAFEGETLTFEGPGDARITEPHPANDKEAYGALFEAAPADSVLGEASPIYISSSTAPHRIQHYLPEAKLIAILRHPAERAFSNYCHLLREGRETLGFAEALEAEESRKQANWAPAWQYKSRGFYHRELSPYYTLFDPEQIRVYLFEDLISDPIGLMQEIFRFVGADATFTPDTKVRYNMTGVPRSRILHSLCKRFLEASPDSALKKHIPKRWLDPVHHSLMTLRNRNLRKLRLDPGIRAQLVEDYRDEILALQALIGRDLSHWLTR